MIKVYRVVLESSPGIEPIFAAHSYDTADEVARWSDSAGDVVWLVHEWWPGVRRVFFENGPVPGSGEYHYMMMRQQRHEEQQRAAERAARRARRLIVLEE